MKRAIILSLLTLTVPATAAADTTTVDPAANGACARGATCKTIGEAVGVAQSSDTITVKAGQYAENVTIPAAKTGITLVGEKGSIVVGAATGSILTVQGAGTKLQGMTLFTQASPDPALVSGAGTLRVSDSTIYSFTGTAVSLTGGADNVVERSTIVSAAAAADSDGVKLGAGTATVDSSVVVGGPKGAAYRVTTTAGSAAASLTLNHVTTTGAGSGIVLNGAGTSVPASKVGDITLKVNGSIVHGASTASTNAGVVVGPVTVVAPNAVTATYTNSDATAMAPAQGNAGPAPTITGGGNPTTDGAVLFTKTLRLKYNSPLIDKGGPIVAGESDRDIDGDPRANGAATDIGADEFTNHAPELTLTAPSTGKTGQVLEVRGNATDREGSDDILAYSVDWGDGTKPDQTASNRIQHVYDAPGTYTIKMLAVDHSFATSDPKTQEITVTDGSPPQLQVTTPKEGATVKLTKGKKKKPLQYTIKGVDADPSGIKSIELALTKVGSSCLQYTGKKFAKAACTKYTFLKATLSGNGFKLITKKGLRVPAGTYEIRARGTDAKDNATTTFDKAVKTLVKFKVK